MDITKEQIEKEADDYSLGTIHAVSLSTEEELLAIGFTDGAYWMQKEMDKRRCDNCKYGEHGEQGDIVFLGSEYKLWCSKNKEIAYTPKDFCCKYWEAKNNDKE